MTDVIKEALRYIGCRGEPDERTSELLKRGERELEKAASPAFCWTMRKKADCADILVGNDINEHLKSCENVVFFAATLGAGADRLIRAAEASDMAYAVVLDALASAYIERYCDECEYQIREKTGGSFTWRFSAGYGDYPISLQSRFIRLLSADKRIGLTATENNILIPRKSVTAVIGITDHEMRESRNSCETCNMRNNCNFRREGKSCGR